MNTAQKKLGQRGFTLLLAALVASVVLAMGASIFKLAQKQITLSSVARDSQYAFYAADTGAECALYWDLRFGYFATTAPDAIEAHCDGQFLNADGRAESYPQTMSFAYEPGGNCASVSVEKTIDPDNNAVRTVIHADGFNTRCVEVDTSPRALQRSVELKY